MQNRSYSTILDSTIQRLSIGISEHWTQILGENLKIALQNIPVSSHTVTATQYGSPDVGCMLDPAPIPLARPPFSSSQISENSSPRSILHPSRNRPSEGLKR